MRHLHSGKRLGVSSSHRTALFRQLTLALIERDMIRTTSARAKEVRRFAEKMVTLAKYGDLNSRRRIHQLLGSTETLHPGENRVRNAVAKLYSELAPRFKDRAGGYTQIFKLSAKRAGDNAQICVMRFLPSDDTSVKGKKGASKKSAKPAKKMAAPAQTVTKAAAKGAPEDKPKKAKKKE